MDLEKIYTDSEFSSAVVPAGKLLTFTGYDTGVSGGNIVTRYKDSSGNFGTLSGGGGSGETDFYKCATVSSSPKTWTGYKATFADGVWSFAGTATSGLTYSSGSFTPVVGSTYNDGCTVNANLYIGAVPTSGLVFYAPLSRNASAAETGQQLTYTGTVQFATYNGIPAAHLDHAGITSGIVAASGLGNWTISFWVTNENWNYVSIIAHFGVWNSSVVGVQTNNGFPQLYYQPVGGGSNSNRQNNTWYHVVYQQAGGVVKAWVNGVEDLSANHSSQDCSNQPFYMGSITGDGSFPLYGYLAAARIYNRALNADEITALANEFTPVYA